MRWIALGAVVLLACNQGVAFPASGPKDGVAYYETTCSTSSDCWSAVRGTCPDQHVVDERNGQQVTKGAMINGTAALNSHAEQTWLFHCVGGVE